jgi:hypothetical protein
MAQEVLQVDKELRSSLVTRTLQAKDEVLIVFVLLLGTNVEASILRRI